VVIITAHTALSPAEPHLYTTLAPPRCQYSHLQLGAWLVWTLGQRGQEHRPQRSLEDGLTSVPTSHQERSLLLPSIQSTTKAQTTDLNPPEPSSESGSSMANRPSPRWLSHRPPAHPAHKYDNKGPSLESVKLLKKQYSNIIVLF
jgi:hypothetical protein